MTLASSGPALHLHAITKRFGDFAALDGVNMSVLPGSIHAVLGENGAGKTTLMNVIYGLYQPDAGTISLHGKPVTVPNPKAARDLGIGMIHQHLMLVDSLTVVENVILGLDPWAPTLSLKRHRERIRALSDEFAFDIDPDVEIWRLPMGMRQRVEIIKALYNDADILILDEPTSVLAPSEIGFLLGGLERLRAAGKTVLFITHKLDEVLSVGDRITVMRQGKVSAETAVADTTARDIARMMVGREVLFQFDKTRTEPGAVRLETRNLSATDNRGIRALKHVSIQVRAGEIVGVAGVDGNGQAELAEAICGLRQPDAGEVLLNGVVANTMSVAERRHDARLSFVPEDRHGVGLVLDFSVAENAGLRDYARPPFAWNGILQRKARRQTAKRWVDKYDVRLRSVDQAIRFLSGGNQQKLVFAREVECDPDILVVMQPCKGLDVGAIQAVQDTVLAQRAAGKAILYISTELDHLLDVCDRVAVMCAGRVTGVLDAADATPERIGLLMTGSTEELTA